MIRAVVRKAAVIVAAHLERRISVTENRQDDPLFVLGNLVKGAAAGVGALGILEKALRAFQTTRVNPLSLLKAAAYADLVAYFGRWVAVVVCDAAVVWVYLKYPQAKNTMDAAGMMAATSVLGISALRRNSTGSAF
jgi:branched-subunit amino acid transport protein AzlD